MEIKESDKEIDELRLMGNAGDTNCRICYEVGINPLIRPCNCIGSIRLVHEICLKKWITTKFSELNGAQCEICNFKYEMVVKKNKKCDPIRAIPERFSYCVSVPIFFFLVVTMAIITGFFIKDKCDFKNHRGYSIAVLSICLTLIFLGILILARAIYQISVVLQVKEWAIKPLAERIESKNDCCSEVI